MLKNYVELLEEMKQTIVSGEQKYTQATEQQREIRRKQADADGIAAALLGGFGETPMSSGLYEEENSRLNRIIDENERYQNLQALVDHINLLTAGKNCSENDLAVLKQLYKKTDNKVHYMIDVVSLATYGEVLKKGVQNPDTLLAEADKTDRRLQSGLGVGVQKDLWRAQWAMCYYYAFVNAAQEGMDRAECRPYFEKAVEGLGRYKNEIMDVKVSVEDAFEVEYSIRHAIRSKSLPKMLEVLKAQNTKLSGYHINRHRQKLIQTVFTKAAEKEYNLSDCKEKIIMLATLSGMGNGVAAYGKYESDLQKARQRHIQQREQAEQKKRKEEEARRAAEEQAARKREEKARREEQERQKAEQERRAAEELAARKRREAEEQAARKRKAEEERERIQAEREQLLQEEIPFIQEYLRKNKLHLQYWDKKWLQMDSTGDLQKAEASVTANISKLIRSGSVYTRDRIKVEIKDYYERNREQHVAAYHTYCHKKASDFFSKNIENYIKKQVKRVPVEIPEKNREEYIARFLLLCDKPQMTDYIKELALNRDSADDLTKEEMQKIFEYMQQLVKESYGLQTFLKMGAKEYRIPWIMALYAITMISGGFSACDMWVEAVPGEMIDILAGMGYVTVVCGGIILAGVLWDVHHYVTKEMGELSASYYLAHVIFTAALTFVIAVLLLIGGNSLLLLLAKLAFAFVMFCCSLVGMKMGSRPKTEKKD